MKYLISLILVLIGSALAWPVVAALPSIVPEVCQGEAPISECNLDAFEQMIANAAQVILGIAGSLVLLMFVYGGAQFLFSGGNTKTVDKGKTTLQYATLGLAIILLAGVAIKLLIAKLAGVN